MRKKTNKKLKINTTVNFNIDDLDKGKAMIRDIHIDNDKSIVYKIEVIEGSFASIHRNECNELWVNDFEVEELYV